MVVVMGGRFWGLDEPVGPLSLVLSEFLIRKSPVVASKGRKHQFGKVVLFFQDLNSVVLDLRFLLIWEVLLIFFLEIICKLNRRMVGSRLEVRVALS